VQWACNADASDKFKSVTRAPQKLERMSRFVGQNSMMRPPYRNYRYKALHFLVAMCCTSLPYVAIQKQALVAWPQKRQAWAICKQLCLKEASALRGGAGMRIEAYLRSTTPWRKFCKLLNWQKTVFSPRGERRAEDVSCSEPNAEGKARVARKGREQYVIDNFYSLKGQSIRNGCMLFFLNANPPSNGRKSLHVPGDDSFLLRPGDRGSLPTPWT